MKKVWKRINRWIRTIFLRNGRLRPCILPVAMMALLLVLLGAGANRLVSAFEYNRTEISEDPEDLGITETTMELPEGITNIALFGIDARNEEFRGLSDSIMIITIDAEHNDIKVTSILRDSLVKIDGYGHQKINAAYSLGGPQLAIKTLNQTFNLNIRNYATVDFVSMADIIDFVGGIEAELTSGEVKNANVQIRSMNKERGTALDYIEEPGLQTLNGIQAVAFARIRKAATINGTVDDIGRTERQRLVMQQLFEKALATDITQYPAMIKAMLPCMETSLTYSDIFGLAGILTNPGLTFKEARIPATEALIAYGLNVQGLGSCKYYNLDYAAAMLNAFIYEDLTFEEYMEQNGVDRTPWFTGPVVNDEEEAPEESEVPEEEVDEELNGEEGGVTPADPDEPVEDEEGSDLPVSGDGTEEEPESPEEPAEPETPEEQPEPPAETVPDSETTVTEEPTV